MEKLREMEVARQEMKRQAFEEAFQGKLGAHICQFDLDDDGNYEDRETLSGWEMWQAAQEQMLQNLYTRKMVCAIENRVQDQMDASGVQEPLHRLDGWTIVDSIVEKLDFHHLHGTHVLVPKEPNEDMIVNALAVIATGISKRSIDDEIRMLWAKMLEAAQEQML